ncbi:MAG TPA: hypothetical protein VFW28_14170 [Micropepsaceae bacterium]|nr:hypothetical protein [Micropepsaceae bacterium]
MLMTVGNSVPNERDRRRYQVLENNDVAIVAARPTVFNFPSRPVIGAAIVTINKANGELNIGSVDAGRDGQGEGMTGVCKLNSAAPNSKPATNL